MTRSKITMKTRTRAVGLALSCIRINFRLSSVYPPLLKYFLVPSIAAGSRLPRLSGRGFRLRFKHHQTVVSSCGEQPALHVVGAAQEHARVGRARPGLSAVAALPDRAGIGCGCEQATAGVVGDDSGDLVWRQAFHRVRPVLPAVVAAEGAFARGDPQSAIGREGHAVNERDERWHPRGCPGLAIVIRDHDATEAGSGNAIAEAVCINEVRFAENRSTYPRLAVIVAHVNATTCCGD